MKNKQQGAAVATPKHVKHANNSSTNSTAKLTKEKDITKVLDYFRYKTATTLDCMLGTGVLRNSITWYVVYLIREGLLQVIYRRADIHTGRKAQYYSADPTQWTKPIIKEGDLWG